VQVLAAAVAGGGELEAAVGRVLAALQFVIPDRCRAAVLQVSTVYAACLPIAPSFSAVQSSMVAS
jgi:hypothetical protein